MLDSLLQPSTVTRLLHLLRAAQPFLTPNWCRLADMCISLLSISELFFHPHKLDVIGLLRNVRGCTPSDDMNSLLCAIRPFCSEEELQMLQMYEQFQQMQKALDMWKLFSDLMPGAQESSSTFEQLSGLFGTSGANSPPFSDSSEKENTDGTHTDDTNPLLSFLTPEQLSLYNHILSDEGEA